MTQTPVPETRNQCFNSGSTSIPKDRADRFYAMLSSFLELAKKETAGVKALAVYDRLSAKAASPTHVGNPTSG